MDTENTNRFGAFLKRGWFDLIFLGLLAWLLYEIVRLAIKAPPNVTEWLLVYLTGMYALLTLYLALISTKSALAAERAAKAMEESIEEARLTRWAQFAATVGLPDGDHYVEHVDGHATLRLTNVFSQPMVDFSAAMWRTELNPAGEHEVRYSSMIRSQPRSVLAAEQEISLDLQATNSTEAECRSLGELALLRFQQVFNKKPQHTLCMIAYYHRAGMSPMQLVYDLKPTPETKRVHEVREVKAGEV